MALVVEVELAQAACERARVEHDHAWRRVADAGVRLTIGEYRCDLCPAVWRL